MKIHGLHFNNLKGDIAGGITAAIVALPLSLAFGMASGLGPQAGLISAITIGFIAALFGGSPAQISGPNGPITVAMATIVATYAETPVIIFTIVMLAGIMQIIFGLLKIGQYISLMPFPVISGFMSGVGVIIILIHLPPLLGQSNQDISLHDIILNLPSFFLHIDIASALIGVSSLLIVIYTPKTIRRYLPSPLVALFVCTLVTNIFFPTLVTIGTIELSTMPNIQTPTIIWDDLKNILSAAFILALIGSIDSLLTGVVAQTMTRCSYRPDRELIAQGLANLAAGSIGGIAGCGGTSRTVTNIRVGGRTPISGMLHALILLTVLLGMGSTLSHIPVAALAGILIYIGFSIIDWGYIKRCKRAPRASVSCMFTVLLLCIVSNLVIAVSVGIVLSSLLLVKRMADLELSLMKAVNQHSEGELTALESELLSNVEEGRIKIISLAGPLSFGAAREMSRRLNLTEHCDAIILDMSGVTHIDTSTALMLEESIQDAQEHFIHLFLVGANDTILDILNRLDVVQKLLPSHVYPDRVDAIYHSIHLITE